MRALANDGIQETPEIPAKNETFDEVDLSADPADPANPAQDKIELDTPEVPLEECGSPIDVDEPIEKEDELERPEVPKNVTETIEAGEVDTAAIEEEIVEEGMSSFMVILKGVFTKNARMEKKVLARTDLSTQCLSSYTLIKGTISFEVSLFAIDLDNILAILENKSPEIYRNRSQVSATI